MKLFIHPTSPNCVAVLALVNMLRLTPEIRCVDLFDGEQRLAAYLEINPNGLVPALQDEDFTLWETVAIMDYLWSQHQSPRLPASEARERADVLRWMVWGVAHWIPSLQVSIFERFFKPMKGLGTPDLQRVEDELPKLNRAATLLDKQLSKSTYLCGDTVSIADLYLASYPIYASQAQFDFQSFKHLTTWLARVHSFPEWREAVGLSISAGL